MLHNIHEMFMLHQVILKSESPTLGDVGADGDQAWNMEHRLVIYKQTMQFIFYFI